MFSQVRVLFLQFRFRIVDESVLSPSAGGDATRLFAQYGSILFYVSLLAGVAGLFTAGRSYPPGTGVEAARLMEHLFISTTMLLAGLLCVFSWDGCFPDRRDALVLLPLPVPPWKIFLAKVAAVAASLALMVGALHCVAGLVWPAVFTLAASPETGIWAIARGYAAYWVAIAASSAFVLTCLLCIQGLLAMLPRPLALRLSPMLQVGTFSVLLMGYFMEGHALPVDSSPTYWFLGLHELIAGRATGHLNTFAYRALFALACSCSAAAICFSTAYLRTLRSLVQQPNLAPGRWPIHLPEFGRPQAAALSHFQLRTLARTRQQRFVLALFLGLAFAVLMLFAKTPLVKRDLRSPSLWSEPNAPLLVASFVMLFLVIAGCRVAFSIPVDLTANWIFQLLPCEPVHHYATATRGTLILFAAFPALVFWAVVLAWFWPWRPALGHLAILTSVAAVLVESALVRFQKMPFTCSYLPGNANVYYCFVAFTLLALNALLMAARIELPALQNPWAVGLTVGVLLSVATAVRRLTSLELRSAAIHFEELTPPVVISLLSSDGPYRAR
ncbi:MAG: hypothetical protein JNK87_17765 [Bryobacterales bacterium]|nr:hypothetical protein [Bryobacterales bacterium]